MKYALIAFRQFREILFCVFINRFFFLVTLFDILDGCKRKFCWQTNNKFWFEYTELLLHLQNIYFDIDSLHSKFFSRCNLKKDHDRFTMVLVKSDNLTDNVEDIV